MTYEATRKVAGRWVMTFMRFDPAGGHDGFTVIASRDIDGRLDGALEPGQWYAVALYRAGGSWICPDNARESSETTAGVVSSVCYGKDDGSCAVKLTVRSAAASTSPQPHR